MTGEGRAGEGVRFLPAGDAALVVELGDAIDRAVSARVLRLAGRLAADPVPGVVETLPSFRSLLVHYDPLETSGDAVEAAVATRLDDREADARRARLWRIPACYEGDLAPDLAGVAAETGLSPAEVVALHSGETYHVYMLGFMPGFPYMGDAPEPLRLPRLREPRLRVPAGSVAIAIGLTGVYPFQSPGGWRLIGSTPVRLTDEGWAEPTLLRPGDKVRFEPISAAEHARLRAAVERGEGGLVGEEAPA